MFKDRIDAGRQLAARLPALPPGEGAVLALPRGGVPVAAQIAEALKLPLGLELVRKVGLPGHSELAAAAIAGPHGEVMVRNDAVIRAAGLDEETLAALADAERRELARRRKAYLGGRPPLELTGKTVIVTDDGIATGATMRAALRAARARGARRLILAVPVGPPGCTADFASEADEVICLEEPPGFVAVGASYRHFGQVPDAEVIALMKKNSA